VRLYLTPEGLARADGDELLLLDLPHRDVGELLADDVTLALGARVTARVPLDSVTLLAPLPRPKTVVLVGVNYADHVAEAGMAIPKAPAFFPIPVGPELITAPGAPIVLPARAPGQVDYEAELAVVIGAAGQDIPTAGAWRHIAGFTAANDVSARDVQLLGMREGKVVDLEQIRRAKSFPTFKPLGPSVVTSDEFGQPPDLAISTLVNGEPRQQSRTSEMLFAVDELVAAVSARIPLQAGDLVLTGTPSGVGLSSGDYLRAGDTVEVIVDGIGSLRNEVITGGV
jgi:2-keto-4-pentenoate hydratase/2-oxohepta-3-ene-1,7-dioic acid hydratase in catechol pathway